MPDQSSAATEHAILAEITRPLEALPDDPLAVVDADFPSALRGYDRVAVEEYVRRTRRLVAELQATRSPEAAVRRALERVGEQISGILQRAHETAEQITAQSRSEAEDRLEQARVEAAHVAAVADQRVRDLDADTDRIWLERQRIVADAEDLAAQLLALAKTAAERFPADVEAEEEAGAQAGAVLAYEGADTEAAPAIAHYDEDHDLLEPEPEPEPDDRSEIERTLAFQPLDAGTGAPADADADAGEADAAQGDAAEADAGEADTGEGDAGQDAAGGSRIEPARGAGTGARSEDDTAVIPPASQAAHRRHNP